MCRVHVGVGIVVSWADRRECGDEVFEGPCERRTRVSDVADDKLHPPPMLSEGHEEGGILIGLLRVFLVASEISGEPNIYESEGA